MGRSRRLAVPQVPAGPRCRTRGVRLTDWAIICKGERKQVRKPPHRRPQPARVVEATADVADASVVDDVCSDFFDALHAQGPIPHSDPLVQGAPTERPSFDFAEASDALATLLGVPELSELPELLPELDLPPPIALGIALPRPTPTPARARGGFHLRTVPKAALQLRWAQARVCRHVQRLTLRTSSIGSAVQSEGGMRLLRPGLMYRTLASAS